MTYHARVCTSNTLADHSATPTPIALRNLWIIPNGVVGRVLEFRLKSSIPHQVSWKIGEKKFYCWTISNYGLLEPVGFKNHDLDTPSFQGSNYSKNKDMTKMSKFCGGKSYGVPQLSQKFTGIKKNSKTWDLYQSILYTSVYYFLKKTKFFNPGFFFYRPISSFTL